MSAVLERPTAERPRGDGLAATRLLPQDATYTSVTDLVTTPLLDRRPGRLWWAALRRAFSPRWGCLAPSACCSPWESAPGGSTASSSGASRSRATSGGSDRQRRHADLLRAAAHAAALARLDQPLRRDDDAVRGGDRRDVSRSSTSAAHLRLLARPLSEHDGVWPQWRSALVWDFWAIASYLLFSILFWYVGLIPDLATVRDRARTRAGRCSTAPSRWAGAARPGSGTATTSSTGHGGARACRWSSRCTASSASTSPPA